MSKNGFFEEVEISEFCFLDEASRWISLGYFPEEILDEEGVACQRFGFYATVYDEGYMPYFYLFQKYEFEYLGLQADDWKHYEALVNEWQTKFSESENPDENYLRKNVWYDIVKVGGSERRIEYWSEDKIAAWKVEVQDKRKAVWKFEAPLIAARDSGRMKLYDSIMSGDLIVSGLSESAFDQIHSDFEQFEDYSYEQLAEKLDYQSYYQKVPRKDWSIAGLDWDLNCLKTPERSWKLLRVSTEELFDKFPMPMNSRKRNLEVLDVGAGLITQNSDFQSSRKTAKTLGRPSHNTKPITKEFLRRKKLGELPEKKEAAIAEAIEWSHDILDQPLSRSSAQRALKPVYEDLA